MSEIIKTKQSKKPKNRFRFVILNDETFEEKFSLSLSRNNAWVFIGTSAFILIFFTAAAIIYTPLKYFIPGFGDYNYRSEILQLQFKTDSLVQTMQARQLWVENLINVMEGKVDTTIPAPDQPGNMDKGNIKLNEISQADQQLRKEVEDEDNYALSANSGAGSRMVEEVRQMHMIDPVEGYVTDGFDLKKEHFGIDIAAKQDAPVLAVLDGKVISASFSVDNGYVIAVQHTNNLVSFYKHNSKLLKKTGELVRSGDVIAFVGSTGENSTGPHLHFELWHEGRPLNPQDYIVF